MTQTPGKSAEDLFRTLTLGARKKPAAAPKLHFGPPPTPAAPIEATVRPSTASVFTTPVQLTPPIESSAEPKSVPPFGSSPTGEVPKPAPTEPKKGKGAPEEGKPSVDPAPHKEPKVEPKATKPEPQQEESKTPSSLLLSIKREITPSPENIDTSKAQDLPLQKSDKPAIDAAVKAALGQLNLVTNPDLTSVEAALKAETARKVKESEEALKADLAEKLRQSQAALEALVNTLGSTLTAEQQRKLQEAVQGLETRLTQMGGRQDQSIAGLSQLFQNVAQQLSNGNTQSAADLRELMETLQSSLRNIGTDLSGTDARVNEVETNLASIMNTIITGLAARSQAQARGTEQQAERTIRATEAVVESYGTDAQAREARLMEEVRRSNRRMTGVAVLMLLGVPGAIAGSHIYSEQRMGQLLSARDADQQEREQALKEEQLVREASITAALSQVTAVLSGIQANLGAFLQTNQDTRGTVRDNVTKLQNLSQTLARLQLALNEAQQKVTETEQEKTRSNTELGVRITELRRQVQELQQQLGKAQQENLKLLRSGTAEQQILGKLNTWLQLSRLVLNIQRQLETLEKPDEVTVATKDIYEKAVEEFPVIAAMFTEQQFRDKWNSVSVGGVRFEKVETQKTALLEAVVRIVEEAVALAPPRVDKIDNKYSIKNRLKALIDQAKAEATKRKVQIPSPITNGIIELGLD